MLNAVAKHVPWLIGGSADLAPSTKTLLGFDGAGNLYIGDAGTSSIRRVGTDGSGFVRDFITGAGAYVYGLAAQDGRIYIADQSNTSIARASIHGGPATPTWISDVGAWPGGVAVGPARAATRVE